MNSVWMDDSPPTAAVGMFFADPVGSASKRVVVAASCSGSPTSTPTRVAVTVKGEFIPVVAVMNKVYKIA